MSDRQWRMSYLNHLVKVVKGEEPNAFEMSAHNTRGKGHMGEYLTAYALTHGRLPGHARCWSNVLVPTDGAVVDETEVDVLMLHDSGIYVFESKNYSGWTFGSEDQKMWTQTLNRKTKIRFFNPIMQNAGHIRALASRLVVPDEYFTSYIVFSDRCELKSVPASGDRWRICHRDDLLRLVRDDLGRRGTTLNGLQYTTLEERIETLAAASTEEAQAFHVQDMQVASSGTTCPRCGGKLTQRSGKYGSFLGCSNYPRCRYTRQL